MSFVVLAATVATLVQVSDVDHAFSHLNDDERGSIEQVGSVSGR